MPDITHNDQSAWHSYLTGGGALIGEKSCHNYYCTTCGGKAAKASKLLDTLPSGVILRHLSEITLLGLSPKDFTMHQYANKHYFPKEPQVSDRILFLLQSFNRLSDSEKTSLINDWAKLEMPLWLFDGISYYFIPGTLCRSMWLDIIRQKLNEEPNMSLEETMKLKYM